MVGAFVNNGKFKKVYVRRFGMKVVDGEGEAEKVLVAS